MMETANGVSKTDITLQEIARAETKIKQFINLYALNLWSKIELQKQINDVIGEFAKKIPDDLDEKEEYIAGLHYFATKETQKQYSKMIILLGLVGFSVAFRQTPMPKTPKEAYVIAKKVELGQLKVLEPQFADYKTYGSVNIQNYGSKLRKEIKRLANEQAGTMPIDRKGMSLWQKTELDMRSKVQLEMLDNVYKSENDLWWLSSHADCSERCAKWQGKLVSKSLPPTDETMWTGTKEGSRKVYSLNGIVNIVDKYGYKNNIVVGFNCRHRLIAYQKGTRPAQDYEGKDIKRERLVNAKMRAMERKIRATKTESALMREIDRNEAMALRKKANEMYDKYVAFAEKNKIAYYPDRCKII